MSMVSLREVAEACGVSPRTVNRALQADSPVAPKTRQRILEVVKQMGYSQNPAALALKTGKSLEVTIILGLMEERHVEKVVGFEEVMKNAGYSVKIIFTTRKVNDWDSISEMIKERSAAVAIFPETTIKDAQTIVNNFEAQQLPYIMIDPEDEHVDSVLIDRSIGIYEAIEYLVSTGRQHIAYLGPKTNYRFSKARWTPYLKFMRDLGREAIIIKTPKYVGSTPQKIHQYGVLGVEEIMAHEKTIDAVVVFSDIMALGLLGALQNVGIKVPEDIAIVGFDNQQFTEFTNPTLSTVAQPNKLVGKAAAELLLAKIEQKEPPKDGWTKTLPTKFVARGSTTSF